MGKTQDPNDGEDAGPEEDPAAQSFGVGVEPYLFEPEYGSDDPDEMMDGAVDDDDAEPGDEDRRLHDLEYWCDIFNFFARPSLRHSFPSISCSGRGIVGPFATRAVVTVTHLLTAHA
jgi:hypothetical protein